MSNFEFDSTYSALTGEHVDTLYVPTVEHDDVHDILIDGTPAHIGPDNDMIADSGWSPIYGYTNQHGYNGAVFHPSETASDDLIREWVRDAGGDVFALVLVNDNHHDDAACGCNGEECDIYEDERTVGWAIIYRQADLDECPGCEDEGSHFRSCPRWDNPRNAGF